MSRIVEMLSGGRLAALSGVLFVAHSVALGEGTPYPGDFGQAAATVIIFLVLLAILGKYAWKPIVAQIAFHHNVLTPATRYDCAGRFLDTSNRFRCWKTQGHGRLDPVQAISQSCDVYFYHVGQDIGAETLTNDYRQFGFGEKPLGLRIPATAGFLPTQKWSLRTRRHGLRRGDARNLAIGQGDLRISPLQAAVMLATLLTGQRHPVSLTQTPHTDDPVELDLSRTHLDLIRKGMDYPINDALGTGKYAHTPTIRLAGKTGSAQVKYLPTQWQVTYTTPDAQTHTRITDAPRQAVAELLRQTPKAKNIRVRVVRNKRLTTLKTPRHGDQTTRPAHAWFIAYAPARAPRIVIVVFIEYGIAGGSATGPVVKALALKARELGYLP